MVRLKQDLPQLARVCLARHSMAKLERYHMQAKYSMVRQEWHGIAHLEMVNQSAAWHGRGQDARGVMAVHGAPRAGRDMQAAIL